MASCIGLVVSRPALSPFGWQFLEQQRPKSDQAGGVTFTAVADGLDFAIFRRPLGGWETTFGHFFLLANILPCAASMSAFQILQAIPLFSAKTNSDLATLVFCVVAVVQFAAIAGLLSIRRRPASRLHV